MGESCAETFFILYTNTSPIKKPCFWVWGWWTNFLRSTFRSFAQSLWKWLEDEYRIHICQGRPQFNFIGTCQIWMWIQIQTGTFAKWQISLTEKLMNEASVSPSPGLSHDDVIKWKLFPRYWPFVRGIHRSPVNSPHKGQWRGALMFSLICAWINDWVNNGEAGDLRCHRAHYVVTEMLCFCT